jgi:hypothetical protein
MLVERDELSQLFHLQEFAFDHLLGEFDQSVEDAEVALLDGDLEGLHVEPVAGQHALRIAPLGIGCGTAAPGFGLIDNVVVHQGRGMDDLNYGAEPDRALTLIVEQFCGQQQQCRADSLASAGAEVFANLGDGLNAGDGVATELALQRDEVVPQQIEYFFSVNGGRCAQFESSSS